MSDAKETPKSEVSPEELPKEELDEVVGGVTPVKTTTTPYHGGGGEHIKTATIVA
jgi:hypothetical protein